MGRDSTIKSRLDGASIFIPSVTYSTTIKIILLFTTTPFGVFYRWDMQTLKVFFLLTNQISGTKTPPHIAPFLVRFSEFFWAKIKFYLKWEGYIPVIKIIFPQMLPGFPVGFFQGGVQIKSPLGCKFAGKSYWVVGAVWGVCAFSGEGCWTEPPTTGWQGVRTPHHGGGLSWEVGQRLVGDKQPANSFDCSLVWPLAAAGCFPNPQMGAFSVAGSPRLQPAAAGGDEGI